MPTKKKQNTPPVATMAGTKKKIKQPGSVKKQKSQKKPAVLEKPAVPPQIKTFEIPTSQTINGIEFKLVNANPVISAKLSAKYRRRIICREFAHSQRAELIKQIIGPYAVKNLQKQCRFYKLNFLDSRVAALRTFYLYDIKATLNYIFNRLNEENIKLFLHGGIVRDLLTGVRSADIDIIFDKDVQALKPLCEKYKFPCSEIMVKEQYINFGVNKGAGLEGSNLSKTFMAPLWEHESSINALAYDLQNNILIDITGYGLEDIVKGQFRLGAKPDDWIKWAKDAKRPFRYFKMIQKGFKPINTELHAFVTNYIRDNWESVYNRPIHKDYPIPWIKQILIKTMTQGTIDEKTGEYKFGPTEDKLMPFLETIKKNIGNDIFMKIMATFTDADLKHFYENRIITSEDKYIKYKDILKQIHNAKLKKLDKKPLSNSKAKKRTKSSTTKIN